MGILRADRVSGLGGANAINGSVFFGRNGTSAVASGNWLIAYSEDDFKFGTGDFTIEYWFYFTGVSGSNSGAFQISNTPGGLKNSNTAAAGGLALNYENGCVKGIGNNGWFNGTNSVAVNTWNHVALVRHSGTLQIFTNGVADTSASDSQNYSLTHLAIGGYYSTSHLFQGYISNFRIVKGTAVYSSAFTPPTERLTAIDGTVILACQSPGNVLQEATGKNLEIRKAVNSNVAPPMASRFAPDKGEDYGTTFADNTKFDTLSYMVPPGGTTADRSRGRGLFFGGYAPSPNSLRNTIDYIQIQSAGNAIDFGDLLAINNGEGGNCSSSTRGLAGGGMSNIVDITYVTIATTSNALDFGDLLTGRRSLTAVSNDTRGLFAGGTTPTMKNEIEYVTIATKATAQDFGDLMEARRNLAPNASPTRGVFAGGNPGSSPLYTDRIDYVTIASAGDATDFGDMVTAMREQAGSSSSTRGLIAGGFTSPAHLDTIEYITIATLGNALDYGDLHTGRSGMSGTSNGTRGIFAGGSYINNIQYVTIATQGDAKDFGDLTLGRMLYGAASDSHGGIS